MRAQNELVAFNRGRVSRLGLARTDIKRIELSAEVMTNFVPRVLGSMMLRPGLQHLGSSLNNAQARYLSFVPALSAVAALEFIALNMRVWISDALLTRVAVTSAVTNGTFDANLGSWTDNDEAGGASVWVAGGYMGLTGNGTAAAIRDQSVTVGVNANLEHALRISINRGPVTLRVGSTVGGDEYVTETDLRTGIHSIAFTPTGDFNIRFLSRLKRQVLVDSCVVESAGVVNISAPYSTSDLDLLRGDVCSQSVDVLFVACDGFTQRRIERRNSGRSWSIVRHEPDDGPFRSSNVGTMTLTPSVLSGNGTLTASRPFFRTTQAPSEQNGGALFKLISVGQTRTASITAQNTFTSAIRVTGIGDDRAFAITITDLTGTTSEVTLQRSFDSDTGPWTDVTGKTWTADTAENYNDTLENQIAWYRIGVKTGDYVAGTIVTTMTYSGGSITGVCRLTGYTNSTVATIEVLSDFGGTTATDDWAEGLWSDYRGWPSAGTLYEGRLWWAGDDKINGTVSDAFDSHDPDTEGDSGPINRSIGSGPVSNIAWLLPLQRLLVGAEGSEISARSTSFDEPLTPTNFNLKEASTQGAAAVSAVKVDSQGMFVQRGGVRLFQLAFNVESNDYGAEDLMQLIPEMGEPEIVRMAVQRQPDTRVHCVRSDGTVALAVIEKAEKVLCWLDIETDGLIEDVLVLPGGIGELEDRVYYLVSRTVNGATVRFFEKWALESECQGEAVHKQADSFIVYSGGFTHTISGLDHLEGETVVAWTNGTCPEDDDGEIETYVVSGGEIQLAEATNSAVVGLPYRARWKNAKMGGGLTQPGLISQISFILANTHWKGIKFGRDFDNLDPMPKVLDGVAIAEDTIHETFDTVPMTFPGKWSSDPRVCLEANAPRPCTVLAAIVPLERFAKV